MVYNLVMKKNQGFMSLIGILIVFGIIAFLLVRSDLFTPKGQKSFDEVRSDAMDDARNIKSGLEARDAELMEEFDL